MTVSGANWTSAPTAATWIQGKTSVFLTDLKLTSSGDAKSGYTVTGYVVVPVAAVPGQGQISICVGEFACPGGAGYTIGFVVRGTVEQPPSITASPNSGQRYTPVALKGSGLTPTTANGAAPTLYWSATSAAIGDYSVDAKGMLTGKAVIPPRVADGPGAITTCLPSRVLVVAPCPQAAFTVLLPSLTLQPLTARPRDVVKLNGRAWCCPGAGTVTDAVKRAWGSISIDAAGTLSGQATVPSDTLAGVVPLRVCGDGLCESASITVTLPAASATPPTSSPSPPPSPSAGPTGTPAGTGAGLGQPGPTGLIPGASTANPDLGLGPAPRAPSGSVPAPGGCAVQPGSLSATPASAPAGARVTLHLRPASSLKSACRLVVTLGGVQAGPPIDLSPGSALDRDVVVPAGVRDGTQQLDVLDLTRGAVLASMPFDVSGGTSLPWLLTGLVGGGALALLGAGGLAARLLRARGSGGRKPHDLRPLPPPAIAVWPSLGLPAEIVSGEPTFAQFRLQPASGRIDPTLRVDVQLAADHYTAPAGTRFVDVPSASVVGTGMSVPLIPGSVAVPTAVRLVAYVFQQGHLVGWAQAMPTVLPAGSLPRQGTAPVSAVPLGPRTGRRRTSP